MKMFVWRSNLLANYAPGHIIVLAPDVDEARRFALLELKEYIRGEAEDFWLEEEEQKRLRDIALQDLEPVPQRMTSLLIKGSE